MWYLGTWLVGALAVLREHQVPTSSFWLDDLRPHFKAKQFYDSKFAFFPKRNHYNSRTKSKDDRSYIKPIRINQHLSYERWEGTQVVILYSIKIIVCKFNEIILPTSFLFCQSSASCSSIDNVQPFFWLTGAVM